MLIVICLLLLLQRGSTQYVYSEASGDYGNGTVVESSPLSCPGLWSVFENDNGSMPCTCGPSLGGVVYCDKYTSEVTLHSCFCMSFYVNDPNITVVGACVYMCGGSHQVNADYMCGKGDFVSNREGQMCGRCREGYAPPAYSYDWLCVKCSHDSFLKNLVKYCIVAFLPLTIFFVIVIALHISATSPSMNALLLACQVLTSPIQVRILFGLSDSWRWAFLILESLYGFWNLDFFRTLYPPFCLHPNMSTLQVI